MYMQINWQRSISNSRMTGDFQKTKIEWKRWFFNSGMNGDFQKKSLYANQLKEINVKFWNYLWFLNGKYKWKRSMSNSEMILKRKQQINANEWGKPLENWNIRHQTGKANIVITIFCNKIFYHFFVLFSDHNVQDVGTKGKTYIFTSSIINIYNFQTGIFSNEKYDPVWQNKFYPLFLKMDQYMTQMTLQEWLGMVRLVWCLVWCPVLLVFQNSKLMVSDSVPKSRPT